MSKGLLIGIGRTAEIFAWGDDKVLKLFFDWCPYSWIEREEKLSRVIYESGLSVPAVEGIIEVDGRTGIIFEQVEGGSMLADIQSNQNGVLRNAEILAELHASIHSLKIIDLPSLHETIERDIRHVKILAEEDITKVLYVLNKLKDGTTLCHYDYHPMNIIMSPRGPMIIDWMTARKGNSNADVARTLLTLQCYFLCIPPEWHTIFKLFIDRYLTRYLEIQDSSLEAVKAWRLPIAAARLNENIPHERVWLLSVVKKELIYEP